VFYNRNTCEKWEEILVRYIKQFAIILAITCVGELLKYFIPLPIPASIYGLVLMLVLLMTRRVRLESVKETAEFLIEIMPMMFIPAAVGLLVSWNQLRSILVPTLTITVVSTFAVIIVTGKVTDFLTRDHEKRQDRESEEA